MKIILKRIIIFLLIFTILINTILIPKSYAIDPITLTLGALYTYEVAQALYLTILTATAIGVTFATIDEWKNYHDMLEGTSPGPIEEYPEWEGAREQVQQSKSELATNHWFEQWDLKLLPGGGGDPDPGNNKKGILAFMGATGIMGGFINNFISMFQKLELENGENIINMSNDNNFYKNGYNVRFEIRKMTGTTHIIWFINSKNMGNSAIGTENDIDFRINDIDVFTNSIVAKSQWKMKNSSTWYDMNKTIQTIDILPENEYLGEEDLLINLLDNSPVINPSGPLNVPQPNLIPIPRHNPSTIPLLNLDGKPKPGIQSILNPDGSIEERYYGDVDDLLEDIVMNTPIDKILNPDSRPYEIKPGSDHIKITYPDSEPTVPYPQPEPYPYPTPNMPPGILPGQYPGPGPYPPGFPIQEPGQEPGIEPGQYPGPGPYPFPEPDPYPNPSPQTPVEPGKQLDYTPLLQIIINWLSRIWNKIPLLPDTEVDEELPNLLLPEPDYIKDKVSVLEDTVRTKLNIPDITPLPGIFESLECTPIPDQYFGDNKIIDMTNVNNVASKFRDYQRFFWWIVIILIGANNAYKLIRGTDLITIYGRGGKGN